MSPCPSRSRPRTGSASTDDGRKGDPPTGKSVVGKGTYFARVKGGKVVELNSYPDIAGMMMQLGFMPQM